MSEIINNSRERIDALKKLILEIHGGSSSDAAKFKLSEMFGSIPYGEVVQAEQELINNGLPADEILKYCDLHSDALKGNISLETAKSVPVGHPVHTFLLENIELKKQIDVIRLYKSQFQTNTISDPDLENIVLKIRSSLNNLMDVDKHYARKENLLFPFLEKHEITGPPMVMWGKHDEIRGFLKSAINALNTPAKLGQEEVLAFFELLIDKTIYLIDEMIYKEEKILFPMCLDTLTEIEWYEVYKQSNSIGYCLLDPKDNWEPNLGTDESISPTVSDRIQLSTGSFSIAELEAVFSTIPVDLTFVDRDDTVKYYSHGKDRIFERNRAIIGRKVQFCHPPSSVHIVEKILSDFKSGEQNEAKFWINFKDKMVHIAYYAIRSKENGYLGTLEVTQDIKEYKTVEGERRLLTYEN